MEADRLQNIQNSLSDFKWPIAETGKISAPAEKVWEIISSPGNLELCHPFCARNPVLIWPGENSRDEVHYLNGLILERRFCRWIPGTGYDLEIGRPGGETSYVTWRVLPKTPNTATLEIVVYPYLLREVPVAIRWLPHILWLRPRLSNYLKSVVGGVEWFVTRKEAVPRNQFGRHPWFST